MDEDHFMIASLERMKLRLKRQLMEHIFILVITVYKL